MFSPTHTLSALYRYLYDRSHSVRMRPNVTFATEYRRQVFVEGDFDLTLDAAGLAKTDGAVVLDVLFVSALPATY